MKKRIGLLIIWMIIIFLFSNQNMIKSSNLSNKITDILIMIFNLNISTYYIRKLAHIIEYFMLCLLILKVFEKNKKINKKIIIYTLFICIIYACTDEIHQLFIYGRCGKVKDILIDTLGSILGIFNYKIFNKKSIS